jgi:hypothetical protein
MTVRILQLAVGGKQVGSNHWRGGVVIRIAWSSEICGRLIVVDVARYHAELQTAQRSSRAT